MTNGAIISLIAIAAEQTTTSALVKNTALKPTLLATSPNAGLASPSDRSRKAV